ncbi:MAG: D-TA family PLP-dependent enzyme [Candidatus Latescibacteria bacterium]|nr:D-TA family PLP-dependent enzyme [Candidatus Latescibacterota bacterium]
MHFTELDTPALTVDLDILEKNIDDLQQACNQLPIDLRVHTKTHKTPQIARMQIKAGAIGIVSQKLGEAEAMANAGIENILIPYNIVGRPKLERLTRLIKREVSTLTLAADSATTVEGLSRQAVDAGCSIRTIVEMDCGSHRVGAQSPAATLELAQLIDALPGLQFCGVMTYASGPQVKPYIEEVRALTQAAGLPLEIVSAGGTGSQEFCHSLGCTETRIGSYAYEGLTRVGKREDLHPDRCPLRVVVTVVSTSVPGQAVVDAGMKAMTSYPPTPYGYCLEYPEIYFKGMSVEHGHLDITAVQSDFKVGQILSFIPLHGGMTTNLYDCIYPVRGGQVVDVWEVGGRGRAQ